jgi:hypothetical protein
MQGVYGRRYRIRPRFFLIIAVLLGLAVWLLLYLAGAFSQPKVEWGKLASDQTFTAIVLRDEQLVEATEYSKLACLAAEGQSVAKDADVATLYLSGFSDKDIESLAELRNTIKDYQENNVLKSTVNKDLQDLNKSIDDKMGEISAKAIGRQTQDMAVAEAELRTLMQQRKDFMLTITNQDDTLERYYQLEENLVNKINQTRKTLKSPADGLISYYLDGHEAELTVNGISDMTPAKVKKLLEKLLTEKVSFNSSVVVEVGRPICRIVNPAKWYAVIVMSSRENPFVQGMEYPLTFGGLQDTVNGRAVKVSKAGGDELVVLEIPEGVQNMLSLRVASGHLGRDIDGFRIPVGMLKEDNGKYYIAIKGSGANVRQIEVNLLGRDEKYAIISDVSGASELAPGLPLVKPRP